MATKTPAEAKVVASCLRIRSHQHEYSLKLHNCAVRSAIKKLISLSGFRRLRFPQKRRFSTRLFLRSAEFQQLLLSGVLSPSPVVRPTRAANFVRIPDAGEVLMPFGKYLDTGAQLFIRRVKIAPPQRTQINFS